MFAAHKIGEFFLDLVFPAVCAGCKREGTYICKDCALFVSENALICPVCQESSLTGETHLTCSSRYGLEGLASMWDYDGPVKEIIAKIKYNFVTHAVQEVMQRAWMTMTNDHNRFGKFLQFLLSNQVVTYAPMFLRKEKKRGFNQAELFARELAQIARLEVLPLLEKTRDTKSQTELERKERIQNAKASFEFNSKLQIPKRVVLVDDVWTSGATMQECCRVLKKAGVEKVWGFTLARTP